MGFKAEYGKIVPLLWDHTNGGKAFWVHLEFSHVRDMTTKMSLGNSLVMGMNSALKVATGGGPFMANKMNATLSV